MKTLTETLRQADPLDGEPRQSEHERRLRREIVLHSLPAETAPSRRAALTTVLTLAITVIGATWFYSWQTAVGAMAAVRFEVRLAEENFDAGLREVTIAGTDRKIYLHVDSVVENIDIARARVIPGDMATTFGVAIEFTPEGAGRMLSATQNHIGRPLAILVDGEVVSAPIVRAPIATSAILSGRYTQAEADYIRAGLLGR